MNWSLLVFGVAWVLSTLAVRCFLKRYENLFEKRHIKESKHIAIVGKFLFPSQFGLAGIALFICGYWFFTGRSLLTCDLFQNAIERGTFEALSSVMGIVGIGSLFLGWIFSERDKCTMGKSQIEMIHFCYGRGYGLSIVVHFVFTAVTLIMVNCKAREPALISFLTLAWGCVPQVLICMRIGMNKSIRRKLALKLWAKDGENADNLLATVHAMAAYLSDTQIRYDTGYIEVLSGIMEKEIGYVINIYDKSLSITSPKNTTTSITSQRITTISIMLRDLFEIIPAQEREYFEEILLKNICAQLCTGDQNSGTYESSENQGCSVANKDLIMATLCYGYMRYVYLYYSTSHQLLSNRVQLIANFTDSSYNAFANLLDLMSDTENALKWLLFLSSKGDLPRRTVRIVRDYESYKTSFRSFVESTLSDENFSELKCNIAWEQLYPRGERNES